jgi:hypothetical protein
MRRNPNRCAAWHEHVSPFAAGLVVVLLGWLTAGRL